MKKAVALALIALTVVLAGCASTTKVAYVEFEKPNALFHYRNARYSYLQQPQALENGYSKEITPANLEVTLQEYSVTNRSYAVVSIFWDVSVPETEQIISTWTQLLKKHQFERIVFIRENGDPKDTTVIHDSQRTSNPPITAGAAPWVPMRAGNVFM